MNNRVWHWLENGYDIKDSGYGTKPAAKDNQKAYYVKSDTPGLKMWVLLEKEEEHE